jgi:hypothetical protein
MKKTSPNTITPAKTKATQHGTGHWRNIPENGIKLPEDSKDSAPRILNATRHNDKSTGKKAGGIKHVYKWREWFSTIKPREMLQVTIQPEHEFCRRNPEFAGKTVWAEVHCIDVDSKTINLKIASRMLEFWVRLHLTVLFDETNPHFLEYNPVRILSRKRSHGKKIQQTEDK